MNEHTQKQKDSWNSLAAAWERNAAVILDWRQPLHELIAARLRGAGGPTLGAVLDFATGLGEPGVTVAARCPEASVVGLDVSEQMVAAANRRAQRAGAGGYRARLWDGGTLRSLQMQFDAVSCCFGLEYVADLPDFFQQLAAITRAGAPVVITTWSGPAQNSYHAVLIDALREVCGEAYGADAVFKLATTAEQTVRGAHGPHFEFLAAEQWSGVWPFNRVSDYWQLRRAVAPGRLATEAAGWPAEKEARLLSAICARVGVGTQDPVSFTGGMNVLTLRRR